MLDNIPQGNSRVGHSTKRVNLPEQHPKTPHVRFVGEMGMPQSLQQQKCNPHPNTKLFIFDLRGRPLDGQFPTVNGCSIRACQTKVGNLGVTEWTQQIWTKSQPLAIAVNHKKFQSSDNQLITFACPSSERSTFLAAKSRWTTCLDEYIS